MAGGTLFGATVWDPALIIAQIITVQCFFYTNLGLFLYLLVGMSRVQFLCNSSVIVLFSLFHQRANACCLQGHTCNRLRCTTFLIGKAFLSGRSPAGCWQRQISAQLSEPQLLYAMW